MKNLSFILAVFLSVGVLITASSATAQAKDSFYFMKDDGEFSAEEKDEEAQYVYENCEKNIVQRTYFDCACIAGAFRVSRDSGPLMPQANLINSLLSDPKSKCTNTLTIAGDTYEFCTEYARVFRHREKDNTQYCECVANKMANDFTKNPKLKEDYISNLRTDALVSCRK